MLVKTKKPKRTTTSSVKSFIRRAWLRSPERSQALKSAGYSCEECGVKQSKAKGREVKVEVHHLDGINWQGIAEKLKNQVFCDPEKLEVRCVDCHKKIHEGGDD